MQENPYNTFLQTIRRDSAEHSVAPWRLGKVQSVAPLVVEMGELSLTGAELLVNPALLAHSRELRLTGVTGRLDLSESDGTVGGGELSGPATHAALLAPGDQVILLQSGDGQQYAVLCKAVSG